MASTFAVKRPHSTLSRATDPYGAPVRSTRVGATYNAHSYPTKINPDAIIPFILEHSSPGDLVFDGFAGSGSTGIAAALSGEGWQDRSNRGARRFLLYDLSTLAAFVSGTILQPVAPELFANAANQLLSRLRRELGWMYGAQDLGGSPGEFRHLVWTEVVACHNCSAEVEFASVFVRTDPAEIRAVGVCPRCGHTLEAQRCRRVTEQFYDDVLNVTTTRRKRVPYLVYGRTGRRMWRRMATAGDLELIERTVNGELPSSVPIIPMMHRPGRWGELHRSGYHVGISHVHHFYTRRNLIAIGRAFQLCDEFPAVSAWLRLWVSSYNASHSTLMARVVAKKGASDLVPTSAQGGALYISSIPVEKNVLAGLATKLPKAHQAVEAMWRVQPQGRVACGSSLHTDVPDASVDYIFTDPPFGDNIQYSEVNFISESWLGETTSQDEEAIVSNYQGKSVGSYQSLLTEAFSENYRILKPGRHMTVVFHSSSRKVWDALIEAITISGFVVERTTRLHKDQGSFKQTTTRDFVRGDCVILTRKPTLAGARRVLELVSQATIESMLDARLRALPALSEERRRDRLHSWLVAKCVGDGQRLTIGAKEVYRLLAQRFEEAQGLYRLRGLRS